MKFEHYKQRVEESKEFKEFKKKNPRAYLAAGFFVLDYETGNHMHQVDYALPNGRIATFILDEGVKLKISEQAIKKKLPKLEEGAKTDLDALKGIVEDEMKNRTVTENIKKIIAVLHILDNKLVWNLQCILDGLNLLNVHVDDSDQTVLKFEKHSLMEMIKHIPAAMMPQTARTESAQMPEQPQPNKEQVKEAEKIVEKIKKQLEAEKEKAKKEEVIKEGKSRKKAKK